MKIDIGYVKAFATRSLCSLETQRSQSKTKARKLGYDWSSSAISAALREADLAFVYQLSVFALCKKMQSTMFQLLKTFMRGTIQ